MEWLVFIHQLPAEPAYLRVKVARRLHRIGAVALKSSVYLLPDGEEEAEDFRWLMREIVDAGGDATLSRATFLDGTDDRQVLAMFHRERDAEYEEITAAARAATAAEPKAEEVQRLRRRLAEITARDRLDAPGRAAAEHAVEVLAGRQRGGVPKPAEKGQISPGRTWVTRRNPQVDRLASAWLIRRFIDPSARFKLVDPAGYDPEPGELRFDMFAGEYGHEGDRCTFETLLERFGLTDPGLQRLGEIVHDIDCKEARFGHPEGPGLAALVRGLAATHPDDTARIEAAMPLLEGLYTCFGTAG